jgi:uncharacterized membrane protein SirB2
MVRASPTPFITTKLEAMMSYRPHAVDVILFVVGIILLITIGISYQSGWYNSECVTSLKYSKTAADTIGLVKRGCRL